MLFKQTRIFKHCNIGIFLTNISFMFNQLCSEHGCLLIQLDSINFAHQDLKIVKFNFTPDYAMIIVSARSRLQDLKMSL